MIINLHVDNARLLVAQLNGLGITWLPELEYRESDGARFATMIDPDGNYIQITELTQSYRARQRALFDNQRSAAQQGDEQT